MLFKVVSYSYVFFIVNLDFRLHYLRIEGSNRVTWVLLANMTCMWIKELALYFLLEMFGWSVTLRNYLDIAKLKLHYTTFDPRPLVNFLIQGTPPPNRKRFLSSLYRLPSSKGRLYLGETFTFPKVFLKEVTLRQFREVLVSQSLHFF